MPYIDPVQYIQQTHRIHCVAAFMLHTIARSLRHIHVYVLTMCCVAYIGIGLSS